MSAWNEFISESFGFNGLPREEQQKRRNSLELAILIIISGSFFNLIYAIILYPTVNYVSLASIAFILLCILYFYITKNYNTYKIILLLSIVVFGFLAQVSLGSFVDASGVVFCSILPALGALVFTNYKTSRIFFFLFVVACTAAGIWEFYYSSETYVIPRNVSIVFFVLNFILIGGIIYVFIESSHKKMKRFQSDLEVERQKSEDLLGNILHPSVSQELKETGEAKAKGFASATVIFCDIVGFSNIARTLTPGELVSQLNLYFQKFDDIIQIYNLEKIKTIGDSYLAVSGIPIESFTHATDAVRAAVEMQNTIAELNNSTNLNRPFQLRIGIHSGPLVAGVVGKKKFTYDIWGDTVNIAARMEQNGKPGHINVSGSTYNLISTVFNCESRGKVEVKNMDPLDMYFVLHEKKIEQNT